MKTADLIPLILYELNECDKYGFELTKNIETKSQGSIVIKQPTLYTLLKKLEKSKFISSYWQDSEIGGKRHYYKLTSNGKAQLSTLPSYSELINYILSDVDATQETSSDTTDGVKEQESTQHSELFSNPSIDSSTDKRPTSPIIDALLETSIIASESNNTDIFENNNIDNTTEVEANISNSDILKDNNTYEDNRFADNKSVSTFTDKVSITEDYISKFDQKELDSVLDNINNSHTNIANEPIKYKEYVNIKNNENYKSSVRSAKNLLLISIFTSIYLSILITLNFLICRNITTPFYYICVIISFLAIIFYPVTLIGNFNNIKIRFLKKPYIPNWKKRVIFGGIIFILILIAIIITNIVLHTELIKFSNFSNFYAPLIIATAIPVHEILSYLFFRQHQN